MFGKVKVDEEIKSYLMGGYTSAQDWKLACGESADSSTPADIEKAAVIGGGTMGRSIAIALCRAGYAVTLVENDTKSMELCRSELEETYKREESLKRMKKGEADTLRKGIALTTDINTLRECDLVIEAVFEAMKLKKNLFGRLEKVCKKECVFGTNTSSLDIDEMSSDLADPTRLVGIHFFNPAHVIVIVEIIAGKRTSGRAVATAFAACNAMKKVGILVGNCPSFVFNRMLAVYLNQTNKLMERHGLLPTEIDSLVRHSGFLMGPLTMFDMNGIDVALKVKDEYGVPYNLLEKWFVETKRFGRKTNAGFYNYDPVTRQKVSAPEVEEKIREMAAVARPSLKFHSQQDVLDFLLIPMVNESCLCLEEGMVAEEAHVDLMFILGFGWPLSHGGPMRWARTRGLTHINHSMRLYRGLEPEEREYKRSGYLEKIAGEHSKI